MIDLAAAGTGAHFLLRKPRTDLPCVPDQNGFYWHPDFRWEIIPEGAAADAYFADAGYEIQGVPHPDDSIGASALGWTPESPGGGWILALIIDTEDGPQAIFAKKL